MVESLRSDVQIDLGGQPDRRLFTQALTRSMGRSIENVPSRSLRIPFRVPVRPLRWRVLIRNANFRTNTRYPGQVKLRAVAVGGMARRNDGALSPDFASTTEFLNGIKILADELMVADMGSGWASAWNSEALVPGFDYLLSVGYLTNRQDVHLSMGGGWWTNGNAGDATLTSDATVTKTIRLPFDICLEFEADKTVREDVLLGDSISAGSNANFPVLEAPLAMAGRAVGRPTRQHGFGGAGFKEWLGPNWGDPHTMKWREITNYGPADSAVIALGNNDIHAGNDLTTLKDQMSQLTVLVSERISASIIACTVTPRATWAGTEKDKLRRAFNDWLCTLPTGITEIADIARAVEGPGGNAPRTEIAVNDGIHFNSAGSSIMANTLATLSTFKVGP